MSSGGLTSFWAVAGGIGTRGISFVFFLLVARELTPGQMGVMAIGLAFSTFMDAFNEFGLFEQMVRQPDEGSALVSSAWWLQCMAGCFSAALLMALSPLLIAHYAEPDLVWVLAAVAFSCLLGAVSYMPSAILTRRLAFKPLAVRNTAAALAGGMLGWLMARHGYGTKSLAAMQVVNALTSAALTWWAASWLPRRVFDLEALRPTLKLSVHTLGSRMVDALTSRVDQLLIGYFFGTATLGLYAMAMRMFDVLFYSVCSQLGAVMLGRMSHTAQDPAATIATYLRELKPLSLVSSPLFLLAALFLPPALAWFAGPKWLPAAPFMHVILGMGVVLAFTFSHTLVFSVLAKPQVNLLVSSVSTVAWLGTLFVLPVLGPIFAAVLWAGRMALGIPIQWFFLRKLTPLHLRDYARQLLPLGGSCMLIGLVAAFMSAQGWMDPRQAPVAFVSGGLAAGLVGLAMLVTFTDLRSRVWRVQQTSQP